MKSGKTNYTFTVNASEQVIYDTIQYFLNVNGFEPHNEDGVRYYSYYDGIWGKRFLEYYVNGNQVTILAYIGQFKKPKMLDDSMVGAASKQEYKKRLTRLFTALQTLSDNNVQTAQYQSQHYAQGMAMNGQYQGNGTYTNSSVQASQFAKDVDKANGDKAIIGFVTAIIGLFLPLIGFQLGGVAIVVEFCFAYAGLKSSKKGFAIATFIIGGIQAVFFIISLIVKVMYIFQ